VGPPGTPAAMGTLVILFVLIALAATFFVLAGGADRVRRVPARSGVRDVVRDEPVVRERIVERPVERPVERVVERPVATERVTERRVVD
jgi:hypothetical protein